MKDNRTKSIVEDAALISSVIGEEQKSWIPGKGVETFNFLGSQIRDLNWRFTKEWVKGYFYLKRDDWYEVTVQKWWWNYWNVYVEKARTDEIWRSSEKIVNNNQTVCHKFNWVRSLKHALFIGQYASENFWGFASPENFFLIEEEYKN